MHDLAILFEYYAKERTLVETHYKCLVRYNPGVPVVPLVYDAPEWILGTIDVSKLPTLWITEEEKPATRLKPGDDGDPHRRAYLWDHCDTICWRYLHSRLRVPARRYVIFEWDTLDYKMSARQFYESVWDKPLVGVTVLTRESRPAWSWWTRSLIEYAGDKCRGIVPLCGTFMSEEVALFIANTPPPTPLRDQFVEVGFPTLCAMNGIEPFNMDYPANSMIYTYGSSVGRLCPIPGIYHPVPYHSCLHIHALAD